MGRICATVMLAALVIVSNSAAPATAIVEKSFPLSLERGSRLAIGARINGRPLAGLLDSAAETTIIDRGFARELKLNQGQAVSGQGSGKGSFDASLVNGVMLEALGLVLKDQTVAVADLSDVGRRLLHRHLDAILGREIFDAARLSIEIEGGHISVLARDHEPRGVRLELVTEHGVETIPVRIESGETVRLRCQVLAQFATRPRTAWERMTSAFR